MTSRALTLIEFEERKILLPEDTVNLMIRVGQTDPQLFNMHETQLRAYLKGKKVFPSSTVGMLRIRFWQEYDRAEGGPMQIKNIYRDICSWKHWNDSLQNVHSLAWILTPLASMVAQCDERIDTLMSNMRDVIHISPVKGDFVDLKLAKLQFEMLMYFDQRKHGAIVQKVESRTLSLNANVSATASSLDSEKIAKMMQDMSHEEIKEKLEAAKRANAEANYIEVKAE